ncbi:MAG TPA: MaoC/PaaZ C-terminal domain-containing protein [Acidimicrobiia bacterium]|jgi:acyl dehydratase|nr:MaoC/PaaZ C-terminal domain-containing protein [Acidimicrobiia bacterium]
MPMNLDSVGKASEPGRRSWTSKDALVYALGVGAGQSDPTGFELEFTTENSQDTPQRVLPTFPVIIGMGAGGMPSFGDINWAMLVHGEQSIEVYGEIPAEGTVESVTKIVGIYDKGSGALAVMETESKYVDTDRAGQPAFKVRMGAFIRGEGGFGDSRGPAQPPRVSAPERQPDESVTYATRDDQALLYRLSGDRNPLHSDPAFAALAGFPKPILHGLCTYGVTGRALLHTLCGSDPARFKGMDARFSKPVMPGDVLTVKMWREGDGTAIFQTVTQDGTVVIDNGKLTYA